MQMKVLWVENEDEVRHRQRERLIHLGKRLIHLGTAKKKKQTNKKQKKTPLLTQLLFSLNFVEP